MPTPAGRTSCALALLALSCGARTPLDLPPPRAPIPHDDASADASSPPVPSPPGCELGPTTVLEREVAPSFLLSLAQTPDGRYAYTTATGWMGFERPRLIVRDATLARRAELALDRLETIHALAPDGPLYGITSQRDPARDRPPEHALYRVLPDGNLLRAPLGPLSMPARPVDRPVAQRGRRIAIPMASEGNSGGLQLVELETFRAGLAAQSTELAAPALLSTAAGWLAVSARPAGGLARVLFDLDGAGLTALAPVPEGFDDGQPPIALRATDSAIAVVGARRGPARVEISLSLWPSEQSLADAPERALPLAITSPASQSLSASARSDRGWIAAAWGVQSDPRGSGAWLVVSDASGRILLAPTPAGETVTSPQSYTVLTALAPHPEGFVLAWSGWQPSARYAIYARIVRCR